MKKMIKKMVAEELEKDKAVIAKALEVMDGKATLEELESLCDEILEGGRMTKKDKLKFIFF